jgi:hypothetical protein
MTGFDKRGNPVSCGSRQAIDALDHACELLHAYQAAPLADADGLDTRPLPPGFPPGVDG